MLEVHNGDKVKVNYTGKFVDGTVFDSSNGREPLEFTVGSGQVIPGFDQAVVGMHPGESKTINISSDQAYGPRYDEAVITVDRNEFPADLNPQVGDKLQLMEPDGKMVIVTVTDSNPATVTLDGNHPLAGEDLVFDIEVVGVD